MSAANRVALMGVAAACVAGVSFSAVAEPVVVEVRTTLIEGSTSVGDVNGLLAARRFLYYEFDTDDLPAFQTDATNLFEAGYDARVLLRFVDRQDGAPDVSYELPGSMTARRSNVVTVTDRLSFGAPFNLDGSLIGMLGDLSSGNVFVDFPFGTFPPDDLDDASVFALFAGTVEPGMGTFGSDEMRFRDPGVTGFDRYTFIAPRIIITVGPVFVQQPEGLIVDAGDPAQLSTNAFGASASSFQWMRDGVPLADDARISGATTDTLSFASTTNQDTGVYTLELTGPHGTTASEGATLAVVPGPECAADVNGDGMATPADFTAWLAAFNVGCP